MLCVASHLSPAYVIFPSSSITWSFYSALMSQLPASHDPRFWGHREDFAARVDLYFFLPCGRKFWFSTHTCILFILYYPAACDRPCSFFYFHYERWTYIVVITASRYLTLGRERRPISWRWLGLEGLKGLITLCCCFWSTWQIWLLHTFDFLVNISFALKFIHCGHLR